MPIALPYLSADDLLERANPAAMIVAMESALRATAEARLVAPARSHLAHADSTLLVMPVAGDGFYATKLVTVTPGNADRGNPVVQGVLVLLSAETGSPVAVLDAGVLTGQRTGAVAAVGIKYLSPANSDVLGIVGTGVQGAWAAIHIAAIRPIKRLLCVARSPESFLRFCSMIERFAPEVSIVCCDVGEVLQKAQCIVTATTSSTPVLPEDPSLLDRKTLVSIGSYRPNMQELPDCAFALARSIVVDSPQATIEVGDVINPLHGGIILKGDVIELSDLVAGDATPPVGRTRILKSVGHAAFDLFAAKLLSKQ